MKTAKSKKTSYGARTGTKKKPHFGNYDIYSNPKPKDTVRIKYATVKDIKFTIKKNLISIKYRNNKALLKI